MSGREVDTNWFQRQIQRLAATWPVAWVFSYTLHHVDRLLLQLSGGRYSIPEVFAGLPVVRLTTTGAQSGEERTVPVVGFRDGERWFLVASNWGGESHPAWYHNLSANPAVELTAGDETRSYVARDATGEEREAYWQRAVEAYGGFEAYRRRSGDREIPVVVLEPAED